MKNLESDNSNHYHQNDLTREELIEIEKELKEEGIIDEMFSQISEESIGDGNNLGIAEVEPSENLKKNGKIFDEICQKIKMEGSDGVKDKFLKHLTAMEITKKEMNKVMERYEDIHFSYDPSKGLTENLVEIYQNSNPELTEAESTEIVKRLLNGCEELTTNFNKAKSEDFNMMAEISEITKDMDTETRFHYLVNMLSAVEALNIQAFPSQTNLQEELKNSIQTLNAAHPEPTEEDCEELQKMLMEAISNNTLILTGMEKARDLFDSAKDSTRVIDFTSEQYDDARLKAEMSLATWIEYQAGNLPSIQEATPESIAIGASLSVEEAKIMEGVAAGRTPMEVAIRWIKILGGLALLLVMGYYGFLAVGVLSELVAATLISVLGTSLLGSLATIALTLPVIAGFASYGVLTGSYIMEKAEDIFDYIVEKLRDSIFPKIKSLATKLIEWVKTKVGNISGTHTEATVLA